MPTIASLPAPLSVPMGVLLTLAALYAGVALSSSTYRLMRRGNTQYPQPYPFRFALAYAATETFLTPPLAQHRARMRAMRDAEARRSKALAHAMRRHPAGTLVGSEDSERDGFVARARATHVSDQVVASYRAAKALHPSVRTSTQAAGSAASAVVG